MTSKVHLSRTWFILQDRNGTFLERGSFSFSFVFPAADASGMYQELSECLGNIQNYLWLWVMRNGKDTPHGKHWERNLVGFSCRKWDFVVGDRCERRAGLAGFRILAVTQLCNFCVSQFLQSLQNEDNNDPTSWALWIK